MLSSIKPKLDVRLFVSVKNEEINKQAERGETQKSINKQASSFGLLEENLDLSQDVFPLKLLLLES